MRLLFALLMLIATGASAIPTKIEITKLKAGAISIDGDLSDSGWEAARRVEQFVEYFRGDNQAPPVPTIAMLTYDANFVYVAFRADDPHPHAIRAPFVDRDKVLGDQDWVAILIDTQNDRRSSMNFRVNPRGIQTDSVTNDANGVEDFSPDFFYEAVARATPTGWTAEMRIPLSTLRYPPTNPQTWGVMLLRNYPRDFRYVMANTPIPKSSNCFVCHASELQGLEGLPAGGHLTLAPYTTAQRDEHRATTSDLRTPMQTDSLESDIGLDMKWSPSAKLTIDGTLNPDFSQIESDVPQLGINSRFALEYPEKRTFFLEGVDLLSTPIRAVYTRTITSPAWGMRATGNSGANAYTLLVAEDRGGGALVLPGPDGSHDVQHDMRSRVLVGRLRRSVGNSFVGFLTTAREIDGGGHNRLLGPDILWKPTAEDRLVGQVLFSTTENPNRPDISDRLTGQSFSGTAARFVYSRDTRRYDVWSIFQEYATGFRADDGFIPQVGFRRSYGEIGGHFYPKRGISFLRPYFAVEDEFATEGGARLARRVHPGFYFQGKWGTDAWVTWRALDQERVNGKLLDVSFVEFSVKANPWRSLAAIQIAGTVGEKIDYAGARVGRGGALDANSTIRPTDHLEVQVNAKREWLDLPEEGRLFAATLERVKLTYTFSSRSLERLIAQHRDVEQVDADREGSFSSSALYGYRLNWQTVFFVGYGDERLLDDRETFQRNGRSFFMKVSYAFQR